VEKETGRVFEDLTRTFKDYGLNNGAQLLLKELGKETVSNIKKRLDDEINEQESA
jgi:hypothetical protein